MLNSRHPSMLWTVPQIKKQWQSLKARSHAELTLSKKADPMTGSTAGTRAADKQLYKDILAQQQENVKLERQCLLAKLKASEEEARAARAACEAAEERDHLRQQPAVEGRPAPLDRRRHGPPRLRPVWRPSTTPTGSTAGTRAVDKQFYKDILAQQQENVKQERQCLLAKLKASEEEARAARAACEAAEEDGPPLNTDDFPELGAQGANTATTSAQTQQKASSTGGGGDNRPAAELPGRAPRARGVAPPPQSAGQPEAAQAPMTGAPPSPAKAPTMQACYEGLAPSPSSPGESERCADIAAAAPGGRGFPRALRGNKPGSFPQEHGAQRGGSPSFSSSALPPQELLLTAGSQGGDSKLQALLEQLTRINASLAQHLPPRSLSGLHRACSAVLADVAPNHHLNTDNGGQH
ncbi:hypothetical protein HPB47_014940 [Ixodes persulcatus]|uniref:Uncharacterized protein n=1 Tax=Ixodes persulcatus TaxID=34615 RepID=A0AC60QXA9_IXOPE|nr:hypothetical protein HPB47_014940 [Ixodes persulcatus]